MAVLLALWGTVQLSGQCSDISDVHCHGVRFGRQPLGRSQYIVGQQTRRTVADRSLVWIRVYGGEYVYWKWTKLHGQKHCRKVWNQDAVVRSLHALLHRGSHSNLHSHHTRLLSRVITGRYNAVFRKILLTQSGDSAKVGARHDVVSVDSGVLNP